MKVVRSMEDWSDPEIFTRRTGGGCLPIGGGIMAILLGIFFILGIFGLYSRNVSFSFTFLLISLGHATTLLLVAPRLLAIKTLTIDRRSRTVTFQRKLWFLNQVRVHRFKEFKHVVVAYVRDTYYAALLAGPKIKGYEVASNTQIEPVKEYANKMAKFMKLQYMVRAKPKRRR